METAYSDRIVAFIDILGFAALVRRLGTEPALNENLHRALTRIRFYKDLTKQKDTVQNKLEVSVFSDSIVISGASDDLHGVLWSAIHLQCDLLAHGILIRGGIARGRTVHADDILYGEGMLEAYHLESKAAIYPRIVIDPKLVHDIKPKYKDALLAQDVDGLWFVDPFSIGIASGNVDHLVEDGHDPHEISLLILGEKIDQELKCVSDVGIFAKWNWLKYRHAIAVSELTKFGKPRFWKVFEEAVKARNQFTVE